MISEYFNFRKVITLFCLLNCFSGFPQYPEPHYPFPEDSVSAGLKSVTVYHEDPTSDSRKKTIVSNFEYDRNGRITIKNHKNKTTRFVYDQNGNLIEEWQKLRDSEFLRRRLVYENGELISDAVYTSNLPHILNTRLEHTYKNGKVVQTDELFFSLTDTLQPRFVHTRMFEYAEGECIRDYTTDGKQEWLYQNGERSCRISYFEPEAGENEKRIKARYNYKNGHFTDYFEINKDSVFTYRGKFEYNGDMHYTKTSQWSRDYGLHEQFYTYNDENQVAEERIFHKEKLVSRKTFYYDDKGRFSETRYYDENGICTSIKTLVYTYYEN